MPVILDPNEYSLWLSTEEKDPRDLRPLLDPYTSEAMATYPVSTFVNSPHNNSAKCIQPAQPPQQLDLNMQLE